MEVELYVYDLSRGLARQISGALLGTQIDAVYHTSIVFGGVEIFFGLGVQICRPGSTHHGAPMEMVPLGTTALPQDVIHEYLEVLKRIYTAESYDLFLHNCNNFSNDLAEFLVGRGIPEHIKSLPQTVLNTPFGQMLRPQLDSAMRTMTQAPLPSSSAPAAQAAGVSQAASTNGASSGQIGENDVVATGIVHNVTSLREVERLLRAASKTCAIIFFTSSSCAPCRIVYPAYDELAAEAGKKAILIKVDIRQAREIASRYQIMATPTFMTFLGGEKENEWTGADERKLRANFGLLLQMARHPHSNLRLPLLLRVPRQPSASTKVPALDKVMARMGDFGQAPEIQAVKDFVATRNSEGSREATLPDLKAFSAAVKRATTELPEESSFAIVDLARAAMMDARVSSYFAEEEGHHMLSTILDCATSENSPQRPYALRLVTLHMFCSMFGSPLFVAHTLRSPKVSSALLLLLDQNLVDRDRDTIRVTAATLAFNLAVVVSRQRESGDDEVLAEGSQLQLLLAILEAIGTEKDSSQAFLRCLWAVGLLVYCADKESEVVEYVKAAEVASSLKAKVPIFPETRGLVLEMADELMGKGLKYS